MTGPGENRLTEIRVALCDADLSEEWLRLQLGRVVRWLDAEREAGSRAVAQAEQAIRDVTTLRAALRRIADQTECTALPASSNHRGRPFCARHTALTALASGGPDPETRT